MEDFLAWATQEWSQFTNLGSNTFRNVSLLIAALVGIWLAVWRSRIASRQARTVEAGLNIDRFQRGAAMLGDERLSVRQAGILMLSELAQQNMNEYFDPVQKSLSSFIRDRSEEQYEKFNNSKDVKLNSLYQRYFNEKEDKEPVDRSARNFFYQQKEKDIKYSRLKDFISEDNHTALEELATLSEFCQGKPYPSEVNEFRFMNLSRAHLRGCILDNYHLVGINLRAADLSSSRLSSTSFRDCKLHFANLESAVIGEFTFGPSLGKMTPEEIDKYIISNGLTYSQLKEAKNVDPLFLENLRLREMKHKEEKQKKISASESPDN